MNCRTGKDLLDDARARITEYTAAEVNAMRQRGEDIVYLDVRELNEWNLGHIPGAVHISRGNLESNVEARIARERRIMRRMVLPTLVSVVSPTSLSAAS